jgi:hypothetical protein
MSGKGGPALPSGFFLGGLFLALAALMEDVRAVRTALEEQGARAKC